MERNPAHVEEIVKKNPRIHTITEGQQVMKALKEANLHAHLVGSVGMGFPSAHDIDVLVVRQDGTPSNHDLINLFRPLIFAYTGHGSLYMHRTKFGVDVEVFFE